MQCACGPVVGGALTGGITAEQAAELRKEQRVRTAWRAVDDLYASAGVPDESFTRRLIDQAEVISGRSLEELRSLSVREQMVRLTAILYGN